MPIINIKMSKPELSKELKKELINDITNLLNEKYNKAKERIVITIQDLEPYDIAFGGLSIEDIKKDIK